jgi:peptidyl-prolyl cis-trans isomerase SurA
VIRSRTITAALGALLLTAPAAAREVLLDGIAAQVGGSVVLHSEVVELSGPVEQRLRDAGRPDSEILRIRADALQRLIEARLMEEVVRRLELGVTDAEVDGAIASIAKDNKLTVEQLTQSVTSHGLTLEEYRGKIKSEIERSKVLNALVRSQVHVEPEEVNALYEERYGRQRSGGQEIHVRHLVVLFREGLRDQETACKMVSDARAQMASGNASFQQKAREISDANAQRGGDMGWIHLDDVAGWMAPVITDLGSSGISDVIENRFGCNLLQVVERRGFEAVSLEEATPELSNEIMMQKTEAEYVKWVDTIRSQTYIELKGQYAEASRIGSSIGR